MEKNIILFNLLKEHKWKDFETILKEDINNEIDVNIRDNSNTYLIQYAIIFNKKDIVSLLINKSIKLDIIDTDGRSLLYYPIKYKYIDILELLLNFNNTNIGISLIDIIDNEGFNALHYSILYNDIISTELLLKYNSNVNIKNKNGYNCLHLAVYKQNIDLINLVLKNNIKINTNTNSGETTLHIACNLQNYEICKLLLENGANPNIQDYEHEITPIIYAITLKDINILNLLLKYNADINMQDYYGNTPLHYVILEDNIELFDYLMKLNVNVNIYNIESKLPLHLVFEKYGKNTEYYISKLLEKSDINLQNNIGNTVMHLLVALNIWDKYKDILIKKNMDIYLKNNMGKIVLSYVSDKYKSKFIDIVINSFIYRLKNENIEWALNWENICAKEKLTDDDIKILKKNINGKVETDICKQIVKKFIEENQQSIPIHKKIDIDIQIKNNKCIQFTTFTGITLDILVGLIYLCNKHNSICPLLSENFEYNTDLNKYYNSLGLYNNSIINYLNFEIVWVYHKMFYPTNFDEKFKKCILNKKSKYIIIPIGIELVNGSHSNYLIYDINKNEIERFEPNGYHNPYKLNYNPYLLDKLLEKKFKQIDNNIIYFKPKDFLPKIGFQSLDATESSKFKKIGDPGGFCAAWTIWYVDMRLSNPTIERKELIEEIIKKIKKYNFSFKNIIRNYTVKITNLRDEILKEGQIDINDWINEKLNNDQILKINNKIKQLIKNINNYQIKRTVPKKLDDNIIWAQ